MPCDSLKKQFNNSLEAVNEWKKTCVKGKSL